MLFKGPPNSRNPQVTSAVGAGWGPRWTLRGQEKANLLAAFTVENSQKIICAFNNGKLNDGGIFDCLNKPSRAGEGYCCANYRLLLLTADHRGASQRGAYGRGRGEGTRRESCYTRRSHDRHSDSSMSHIFTLRNNPAVDIFVPNSPPTFLWCLCLH